MPIDFIPLFLAELNGNLTLGLAGAGAAIGVGLVGFAAAQAVGRNPGAFGQILTIALIGMALAEAIAIYGLVLVLTKLDLTDAQKAAPAAPAPAVAPATPGG